MSHLKRLSYTKDDIAAHLDSLPLQPIKEASRHRPYYTHIRDGCVTKDSRIIDNVTQRIQ